MEQHAFRYAASFTGQFNATSRLYEADFMQFRSS